MPTELQQLMDPRSMPRRIHEHLLRISGTPKKLRERGRIETNVNLCLSPPWKCMVWGDRCIAPLILNLGDRNEWPTSCPDRFTPVKKLMRLGGPQSPSEHFGEEKNILALWAFEPRIVQQAAQPPYLLNNRRGREGGEVTASVPHCPPQILHGLP
jgi:hypothetical protein